MPVEPPTAAKKLLEAAYSHLEFNGSLLPASRTPPKTGSDEWIGKGDWQVVAERAGADHLFFVEDNPVAVFAQLDSRNERAFRELYNKIWSMARPSLLFLAQPGELAVYDLGRKPLKPGEQPGDRLLATAQTIAEVQTNLARFHRECLETGKVFGDVHFKDNLDRADRALIRDLKQVREALAQLDPRNPRKLKKEEITRSLHALLGRCIFVRYLEDRKIIGRTYFIKVAERYHNEKWLELLDEKPDIARFTEPDLAGRFFFRVLQNRAFTYALFKQLADDFNGDTFPITSDEEDLIGKKHLDKLREFLLGDVHQQQSLFFFAYRFEVIPIELISSIYEEFYNETVGKENNQGSHYTPPALVEFVLAHTLTPKVLATKPRVLDPACGSGIFLVESFRRMVRYEWIKNGGEVPSAKQLRDILREKIRGIDINEEAIRVAAFSLYLALLHYQDPPSILKQPRLPHLQWVNDATQKDRNALRPGADFFDVLLCANAFDPLTKSESKDPTERAAWQNRIDRFGPGSAEVVVGNPPWGAPTRSDKKAWDNLQPALAWCKAQTDCPVGDYEPSQAFLQLARRILNKGGRSGLLVSTGVFFKHHKNSRAFRQTLLENVQLHHVVNFAHVRRVFFSGPQRKAQGIAPFASIVFDNTTPLPKHRFQYWSAKHTAAVDGTQCVLLNKGDMHWLDQAACLRDERLWKIYWWGGHRDAALIQQLSTYPSIVQLPQILSDVKVTPGQGFKEANKSQDAGWLTDFRELRVAKFQRYGTITDKDLIEVPKKVEHRGVKSLYSGRRLLLRRGIPSGGRIACRLEVRKFCFRHSIIGFKIEGLTDWQEKLILGVYWSSLAQYFFFLTAGSWGMWHDELQLEFSGRLPIPLPLTKQKAANVIRIVEALQNTPAEETVGRKKTTNHEGQLTFQLQTGSIQQTAIPANSLEHQLDEAIFDLFGLNNAQRDSVVEICNGGLEFYYKGKSSNALNVVIPLSRAFGTIRDVSTATAGMEAYLRTFLESWNPDLEPEDEFAWRVITPPSQAPLLAVIFETRTHKTAQMPFAGNDETAWHKTLAEIAKSTHTPAGSPRVLVDTFFRHVSDKHILVIKRNEQRFWTKNAAREDAEATQLQTILLQDK